METRKVAYAVILTALAVALSPFFIPVAGAKAFPAQHMVNVLGAVLLGPWWAVGVALATGIIRNLTGLGTVLAFPGGMIGAFLAGYAYRFTHNMLVAAAGEVVGTGLLGAIASGLIFAPALMGRPASLTVFIVPFTLSTLAGSIIGLAGLVALRQAGLLPARPQQSS